MACIPFHADVSRFRSFVLSATPTRPISQFDSAMPRLPLVSRSDAWFLVMIAQPLFFLPHMVIGSNGTCHHHQSNRDHIFRHCTADCLTDLLGSSSAGKRLFSTTCRYSKRSSVRGSHDMQISIPSEAARDLTSTRAPPFTEALAIVAFQGGSLLGLQLY